MGGILRVMEVTALTLEDTRVFAERVVGVLCEVGWVSDRAVVLGLSGDLGVGKTVFVQCMAKVLGVTDVVTSSSFVLRSDYTTPNIIFKHLIHIDAYRLDHADELDTIGWGALLAKPHTLVVVEWANKVVDRIPADVFFITITVDNSERVFTTDMFAHE